MTYRLLTLAALLVASPALAQNAAESPRSMPEVLLSEQHQKMVKVGVGDDFPECSLPAAAEPSAAAKPLAGQLGTKATVVAVFQANRPMSRALLRDLHYDIREHYKPGDVATIAIATALPADRALQEATDTKYQGTLLLDQENATPEKLGTGRLPRVYVLNSKGQIEWLDIEYSQSTRREMNQAVAALAGKPE